jgi:uncharacterized membrane protein
MIAGEALAELRDLLDKGYALLVVVMEVDLNVSDAKANHLRYPVEQVASILLLRVEEAVLRPLTCRILRSVVGNARPLVTPLRYAT